LKRGGFVEVSSTGDPREVVALHMKNHYALIVLDLQMPEMDGYEVMEELQKIAAAHPVSILVMSADPTQAKAAVEAGASSFIGKPFVLAEVVVRVIEILETAADGGDRGGSEPETGSQKPGARSQK
ncbi:MAG: response regulator, partial [Thermoanaerobaculia bacterium]